MEDNNKQSDGSSDFLRNNNTDSQQATNSSTTPSPTTPSGIPATPSADRTFGTTPMQDSKPSTDGFSASPVFPSTPPQQSGTIFAPDSNAGSAPYGPGGSNSSTVSVGPKSGTKKKLFAIVAAVVVLLLGVGAGAFALMSGDDKQNVATTTENKDDGKVTLNFAVHWMEDYQINGVKKDGKIVSKGLKQYLDEYTALHPDVKFAIQQIEYSDYAKKLNVLEQSGAAPDMYQIYSPWGASYVRDGMLDEPSQDIQNDVKQNYVSAAGATINGKIWGYPSEINNYALLYNKEMFKQAGITAAPKTWPELVAAAGKLTKRDSAGNITQYGMSFLKDNDWQVVEPFLNS